MKFIKWMATAMFAFFFLSASAISNNGLPDNDDRIIFDVKSIEGKSFTLLLANLQKVRTNVVIEDLSSPTTLYYKRLKNHNGFAEKINLEELQDGRYKVTVEQAGEKWVKILRVEEGTLLFSDTVKI